MIASPALNCRWVGPSAPHTSLIICWLTDQSKSAPSVPVGTIWLSRFGIINIDGASTPQSVSAIHKFIVLMPLPRKAPSWCQPTSVLRVNGISLKEVFRTDNAGRSPKYFVTTSMIPVLSKQSMRLKRPRGESAASSAPPARYQYLSITSVL